MARSPPRDNRACVARRDDILAYADELLEVARFPEYGPVGAQVLGSEEVDKVVGGVSASLELFTRAAEAGAQLVLVHHGMFWRNEPLLVDRRQRGRLEALFRADMTLAAYHLALDAHPELGNNAVLAHRLGLEPERSFGLTGVGGVLPEPTPVDGFLDQVRRVVGKDPLHLPGGPDPLRRVAVVTGQAGHELIPAAHEGYDLLLTGEPEEPNLHTARELGIHLVAAGHAATERFGVEALCERLAERFGLAWEFVDLPNPV
jgi:dinuclear metal center YbgI/SA1388 family protein